ncbi:Uncharacterised protein [Acinetobacter baumannii]|nr:Uncharacterised protein [Acinetobacter baumannii]
MSWSSAKICALNAYTFSKSPVWSKLRVSGTNKRVLLLEIGQQAFKIFKIPLSGKSTVSTAENGG